MESTRELRAICQAGKERDPAWYAIHRRLSIHLTRALLRTPVSPNGVAAAMMLSGALGAVLFATSRPALVLGGAGLLYLAFLLDKVDGEIARYRGVESVRGILLDRFHHRLIEPLVILAAACREYRSTGHWVVFIAGFATVVLANVIEEHQQLPPFVLFKFVRESGRWPVQHRRPEPRRLLALHGACLPLKGFRTFIVTMPLLTAVFLLEQAVRKPLTAAYLVLSAACLAFYVVIQCVYYYAWRLESDIEEMHEQLSEAGPPAFSAEHRPDVAHDRERAARKHLASALTRTYTGIQEG